MGRVCAFSSNSSRSGGRVVVNAIAVEEVYREVFTHQLTAPVASDVRRGPRTWILSSEEGGAAWIDGLNPLKLVWWNIVLSRYGLYHRVVFPREICGCDNGCVNATLPLFLGIFRKQTSGWWWRMQRRNAFRRELNYINWGWFLEFLDICLCVHVEAACWIISRKELHYFHLSCSPRVSIARNETDGANEQWAWNDR